MLFVYVECMARKVSFEFGDTWRLILLQCTLMMAASSFKTYVPNFCLTWHHIPEFFDLLEQCFETCKSRVCYTHCPCTLFFILQVYLFKCFLISGAVTFFLTCSHLALSHPLWCFHFGLV